MKTQQKGFTLIELIIVIVVLGILAVTAAPQFFNFSTDARVSAIQGLAGAANSARDIVHGRALIEGIENNASTETDGGVKVAYGYPKATEEGIIKALNLSETEWDFAIKDVDPAATTFSATVPAGSIAIFPKELPTAAWNASTTPKKGCFLLYTEATSAGEQPKVTITTDGC